MIWILFVYDLTVTPPQLVHREEFTVAQDCVDRGNAMRIPGKQHGVCDAVPDGPIPKRRLLYLRNAAR